MNDLDALDLMDATTPATPNVTTRKCRRHQWVRIADVEVCDRCLNARNPVASRRSRNNRKRGGTEEAHVASLLGGRKVGPLGLPHDVEVPGYMRVQTKKLDRWPSLRSVIEWLDAMQPADDVRAVSLADTPGAGGRIRRLLIVDLDEYARWHGGKG